MSDPIHNPAHYTAYPVQPIEISRHLGFCLGNVVKYVLRAPFKGGIEDLNKALKYLEWEGETPSMVSFKAYQSMQEAASRLAGHLEKEGGPVAESQALLLSQLTPCVASAFREDNFSRAIFDAARETMREAIEAMIGHLSGAIREAPAKNAETRTVTIPACVQHDGYHRITVTLPWTCIHCGAERGEPFDTVSYDGSRRLSVHGWKNPCGHVESYSAVRDWLEKQGEPTP